MVRVWLVVRVREVYGLVRCLVRFMGWWYSVSTMRFLEQATSTRAPMESAADKSQRVLILSIVRASSSFSSRVP